MNEFTTFIKLHGMTLYNHTHALLFFFNSRSEHHVDNTYM